MLRIDKFPTLFKQTNDNEFIPMTGQDLPPVQKFSKIQMPNYPFNLAQYGLSMGWLYKYSFR